MIGPALAAPPAAKKVRVAVDEQPATAQAAGKRRLDRVEPTLGESLPRTRRSTITSLTHRRRAMERADRLTPANELPVEARPASTSSAASGSIAVVSGRAGFDGERRSRNVFRRAARRSPARRRGRGRDDRIRSGGR